MDMRRNDAEPLGTPPVTSEEVLAQPTGVPDEPPTPREPPPPPPDDDDNDVPATPPTEPAPVPIQEPPSEPGGNVPQIV